MTRVVYTGNEFSAHRHHDGQAVVVHRSSRTKLAISASQFAEFRSLERDYNGPLIALIDELAGEIMCDAGVLVYDDFRGCYDTPESIAWYEREAALAAEDVRELQSWYRGSVL